MKTQTCSRCEETKPTYQFFKDARAKDKLQTQCKSCHDFKTYYQKNKQRYKDHAKRRRDSNMAWVREFKAKEGCIICGENKPWRLDFHHLDDNKEHNVSVLVEHGSSKERLQREMDKCVVICRNHHADIHFGDMGEEEIPLPS